MKVLVKLPTMMMPNRFAWASASPRETATDSSVRQQPIFAALAATNGLELRRLFATLLTPVSLIGFTLAAWRLGADLRFTQHFLIADGPLSNWMVWAAIGAAVQACANSLKKMDSGGASERGRQ